MKKESILILVATGSLVVMIILLSITTSVKLYMAKERFNELIEQSNRAFGLANEFKNQIDSLQLHIDSNLKNLKQHDKKS